MSRESLGLVETRRRLRMRLRRDRRVRLAERLRRAARRRRGVARTALVAQARPAKVAERRLALVGATKF